MSELFTALAVVFLAELGDKTQLATVLFAADRAVNPWLVFAGASAALVLSAALGVLVGSALFIALSVYFASGIRVNNNIMDYLDEDTLVSQQITRLQQDLAGLETFNIVVDGHVEGTF